MKNKTILKRKFLLYTFHDIWKSFVKLNKFSTAVEHKDLNMAAFMRLSSFCYWYFVLYKITQYMSLKLNVHRRYKAVVRVHWRTKIPHSCNMARSVVKVCACITTYKVPTFSSKFRNHIFLKINTFSATSRSSVVFKTNHTPRLSILRYHQWYTYFWARRKYKHVRYTHKCKQSFLRTKSNK